MCALAVVYAAEDGVGEVDADLPSPRRQWAISHLFTPLVGRLTSAYLKAGWEPLVTGPESLAVD